MEWISVKDRLPENGIFLVVVYEWTGLLSEKPKTPEVVIKRYSGYWHKKQCFYDTGGYENLEVTHWMPLPDAPKE
jgi:hypothetical protein